MSRARAFGQHIRTLRKARMLTQEALGKRSGLSTDTIRRLEQGSFSPSLDTLTKLCGGLELLPSTLFETFEIGEIDKFSPNRELRDLLFDQPPDLIAKVIPLVRHLLAILKNDKAKLAPPVQ